MSLIKCPECGAQVSDRSDMCPSCGYPTNEIIADLMLKEEDHFAENKARSKARTRRTLKYVLFSCVALILLILVFIFFSQAKDKGYYDGNAWGDTYEEVAEKYSEINIFSDTNDITKGTYALYVEQFEKIDGLSAYGDFKFSNGGLSSVEFLVMADSDNITDSQAFKELEKHFNDLYGESEISDSQELTWKTKNSEILLWAYRSVITVNYYDLSFIN